MGGGAAIILWLLVPIIIVLVVVMVSRSRERKRTGLIECPNCGSQVNPDAAGCQNCGANPQTGVVPERLFVSPPPTTASATITEEALLVATLDDGSAAAGQSPYGDARQITYTAGERWLTLEHHGTIAAQEVLEYDREGRVTWAYDGLREWVASLAASLSRGAGVVNEDSSILPGHKTCSACGWGMPLAWPRCPRCGGVVPVLKAYTYTPWWARLLATWLDVVIVLAPVALVLWLFTVNDAAGNTVSVFGVAQPAADTIVAVLVLAPLFAYFLVMEATLGRTVGKMALKAQVLQVNESSIGWGRSLVRNIFKMLALGGSLVTLLCILFSRRSQRIGDMLAGTIVVRDVTAKLLSQKEDLRAPIPSREEPRQALAIAPSSSEHALARGESDSPMAQPSYAQAAPRRGVAGFAVSLVGFIMPILWPVGLALSWRDIRREKRARQPHGLSLAGLIVSTVGTTALAGLLVAFIAGMPIPLLSNLRDTPENAAVKHGIHSIEAGVESWAAAHGGKYPHSGKVSQAGLADYVDTWPTNPYTLLPMTHGTDRGGFYYTLTEDLASFSLTGYGDDDKAIIEVP